MSAPARCHDCHHRRGPRRGKKPGCLCGCHVVETTEEFENEINRLMREDELPHPTNCVCFTCRVERTIANMRLV